MPARRVDETEPNQVVKGRPAGPAAETAAGCSLPGLVSNLPSLPHAAMSEQNVQEFDNPAMVRLIGIFSLSAIEKKVQTESVGLLSL